MSRTWREGWLPFPGPGEREGWHVQDLDCQRHVLWSFLCSVSSVKMRGDCSFHILVELMIITV
jgi:hypothetical protein